jgi:VWFA-related protein
MRTVKGDAPRVRPRVHVLASVVLALSAIAPAAGQSAPERQAPPTFTGSAGRVALDAVVRDKQGRLVRDLKASDFEVTEDGVPQTVDAFVMVGGDEGTTGAGAAAPEKKKPDATSPSESRGEHEGGKNLIALVFDSLSAQARVTARTAAGAYLDERRDSDYVGVFAVDLALRAVQGFTNDRDRIKGAIDRATGRAGRSSESASGAAAAGVGSLGEQSEPAGTEGIAATERELAGVARSMQRTFGTLEGDQRGFATSNALLAIARGLEREPGRKTIILFSEGMAIPERVLKQFESVVATANRAQVAIYTLDVAGLRTQSLTAETREALVGSQRRRMDNLGKEEQGELGGLTDLIESARDLQEHPHVGLSRLAEETGGFLMRDTNDLGAAFRRVAQDMHFHYVLGYTPSNADFDGRFRTVAVRVRRGGLSVQSRRGYYALPPESASALKPYEAPALAVLGSRAPRPQAFPLAVKALSFPHQAPTVTVPVLVRVPGHVLKYARGGERKDALWADLAVVVVARDESRQEVGRVSQHYELARPAGDPKPDHSGDVLFYRQLELRPGKYALEAVAYDAKAQAASVKICPLDVPAPADGALELSSLMLIDRVEAIPTGSGDASNPLYFGDALLYPNMGDPYRKSATQALGFFFALRSPAAVRDAVIEISRGSQVTAQATIPLTAPSSDGQIRHAGTLPLEKLPPADYELRVTILNETRAAAFSVAE